MRISIFFITLCLTGFCFGCKEKAQSQIPPDISGNYLTRQVEEISGKDPLGGDPFFINIKKEGTYYLFTLSHRDKIISTLKKPWLDRNFFGYIEPAESEYVISRTQQGISCEVIADDGSYHFIVYLEKSE